MPDISEQRPQFSTLSSIFPAFISSDTLTDEQAQERRSALELVNHSRIAQLDEIENKLKHRRQFVKAMITLLFAQNIAVFYLVVRAMNEGTLNNLQLIFSVYTAATLTETGWVIRTIVRSVFGRIDYPHLHDNPTPQEKIKT